jgi:transposase-like protein
MKTLTNRTRTGRRPAGPQIVHRLDGSGSAKFRLEVILKTITGELTIPEACQLLGICESRFHVLRNETLQATLYSLEPRPPGRPPRATSPQQEELDSLKSQLDQAHEDLRVARTQLDLARIHPDLAGGPPPADHAGKKNRSGCQQRKQRWARRGHRKAR